MLERLSKIDELTVGDHYYLDGADNCFYYGDYTARKGFTFSETNQLIANLKKPVLRKNLPDYAYKGVAIERVARAIVRDITRFGQITFVPVPPSKVATDPEYDDRMVRVLRRCQQLNAQYDVRELVQQTCTTVAAHTTAARPRPADLEVIYQINAAEAIVPLRPLIVIVDDVLTTGCHYVAMRNTILRAFPGHQVAGLFVARRVPEAEDVADAFEILGP